MREHPAMFRLVKLFILLSSRMQGSKWSWNYTEPIRLMSVTFSGLTLISLAKVRQKVFLT